MPDFPHIPPLEQISGAQPTTGSTGPIDFSFDTTQVKVDGSKTYFVGWVNQANDVVYTPATMSSEKVSTNIPDGLAGLAFAALTDQSKALDVDELTAHTVAGPAPVQIS